MPGSSTTAMGPISWTSGSGRAPVSTSAIAVKRASAASWSSGPRSPSPANGALATTALSRRSVAPRAITSPPLKLEPHAPEPVGVDLGPLGQPAHDH